MSVVVRKVNNAISRYLGPRYIKLSLTEDDVKEKIRSKLL